VVTKVSSISFPFRTRHRQWDNSNSGAAYETQTGTCTATRTRDGIRNPGYKRKIAEGKNATTAMTGVWDTIDTTPLAPTSVVCYTPTYGVTRHFDLEGDIIHLVRNAPFSSNVSTTKCDNLAKANFYRAVRARRTAMQGMVFLGELRETLQMLRRPVAGLQDAMKDYFRALKKGKKANPERWIKDLGNVWLEHSFGWLPLIHDIKDAGTAYDRVIKKRVSEVTLISESAALEFDRTNELSGYDRAGAVRNQGCAVITAASTLIEQHKVRYRGAIRAQVEAPTWRDDAAQFGFTIEQFIPTVYELLPWSFLADYFSNLGDVLDASVTDVSNLTYVNRSVIIKTTNSTVRMVSPKLTQTMNVPGWNLISGESNRSTGRLSRKTVERTAGSSIPMPSFQFESSLSDGQLGNIAALLSLATDLHSQSPRNFHR